MSRILFHIRQETIVFVPEKKKQEGLMAATIKIENLNQFYGKKQALKDINLTIETGMFGLLGRNGEERPRL